jgi:hypothetical protein
MNRVEIAGVQQVNDLAFYRREGRWVDSRLIAEQAATRPPRVVEFGSAEFQELTSRLARAGRQGCIALSGEILMLIDGEALLIRGAQK